MNAPAPIAALLADGNVSETFKLALSDVLADAGSRLVPWLYITTREGEEIERLDMGTTSIRAHANRAEVYSKLGQEFQLGDAGEIVCAVTVNEIGEIDR